MDGYHFLPLLNLAGLLYWIPLLYIEIKGNKAQLPSEWSYNGGIKAVSLSSYHSATGNTFNSFSVVF
jgi:hypothetical protein